MSIKTIDGKFVASCEVPGCNNKLEMSHANSIRAYSSLVHSGWDWVLGDEMFDHVCPKHKKDPAARKLVLENIRRGQEKT